MQSPSVTSRPRNIIISGKLLQYTIKMYQFYYRLQFFNETGRETLPSGIWYTLRYLALK